MTGYGASAGERRYTVEEFERLPRNDDSRTELSRGRLVREPPPGVEQGWLDNKLARRVGSYVEDHGLGIVLGNAGYVLSADPPTVRGPDFSFVRRDRIPAEGLTAGFWRFAPDLAVEVVSPSNWAADIEEKVRDYLDAGVPLVWVVHPRTKTVTVHRWRSDMEVLTEADVLEGGDVLPGFTLELGTLFERPRPSRIP